MRCALVFIRATHPHLGGSEVHVMRRVFGATDPEVIALCCMVLRTGGWCAAIRVCDVSVSAADPQGAPFLDISRDFLPPARTSAAPQPHHGPIPLPPAPVDGGRAVRALRAATHIGRAVLSRDAGRVRQQRHRLGAVMADLRSVATFTEAACGWAVDRHMGSMRAGLDGPHHDPVTGRGMPAALAFGPDLLATDTEPEDADDDVRYTSHPWALRPVYGGGPWRW